MAALLGNAQGVGVGEGRTKYRARGREEHVGKRRVRKLRLFCRDRAADLLT